MRKPAASSIRSPAFASRARPSCTWSPDEDIISISDRTTVRLHDSAQQPLLAAPNLDVTYGEAQLLWGVSLQVVKGQVVCLIGPNGAGRTTTLNTIIGVLKVKRGRILFNGEDISSLPGAGRPPTLAPDGNAAPHALMDRALKTTC